MIKKISLSLLILSLAGCFGKKELDCASINWTQKGLEDGKNGFDEDKALKLKKKCESQGVVASVVDYKQGWLVGIETHCSPQNAFKLGKNGNKALKKDNCPVEFKTNFAESFKRGAELKTINDNLGPIKKKLKNLKVSKSLLKEKLNNTETEITEAESSIIELNQEKENLKRLSKELEPDSVSYESGLIQKESIL
jgi:hypothetical protein